MPIEIEEFETASAESLLDQARPIAKEALEFLAYNPEYAYSREEIQSALGVDALELLYELSHLEREGLVRHKGSYWTVEDDHEPDDSPDETR